jgi:hypothetical protein
VKRDPSLGVVIAIGVGCVCLCLAGVVAFLVAGGASLFALSGASSASGGSADANITVSAPLNAAVGDEVIIEVTVENTTASPLVLDSVDIASSYITGIAILRSDPAYSETFHIPVFDYESYTLEHNVPPNETVTVRFYGQAVNQGDYSGGVDVCIGSGSDCASHSIRTLVSE